MKDATESIYSGVGLELKVVHDALQSFEYMHVPKFIVPRI